MTYMHWEKKIRVTCFFAILALLQWSGTEPAVSLKCPSTGTEYLGCRLFHVLKRTTTAGGNRRVLSPAHPGSQSLVHSALPKSAFGDIMKVV